jgi:hypothetical protein
MICIVCKELLDILPLYNDGKDETYPPHLPFCNNPKCGRYGLPTVTFASSETTEEKEEDEESKRKKI